MRLALIEDTFAPFLIQDITPRTWRVPSDRQYVTHKNQAVGIPAVEFAVRDMRASWDRFARLMGQSQDTMNSSYRSVGPIVLHEYRAWASNYSLDELPDHLKPFAGRVPQAVIDEADPAAEPTMFEITNKVSANTLVDLRRQADRERAMKSTLGDGAEALFAVHLVREEAKNEAFMPERTHGVYFQQFTGVPPERGMDVLEGLDAVDWSAVHHAYGPATDVPDLLRRLTSDDRAVRVDAHVILSGNITHQGTIYSASIETLPFLMRMIDAPDVDHVAPLDLLGHIWGDGAPLSEGGYPTKVTRHSTHAHQESIASRHRCTA